MVDVAVAVLGLQVSGPCLSRHHSFRVSLMSSGLESILVTVSNVTSQFCTFGQKS